MTRRLLTPIVALGFTFVVAAPIAAQDPSARVERIGRLPAEMVQAKKTDGEIVDGLFLAALARLPTDKEKETATKHIGTAGNREAASLDLAWALVNTKEFLKLEGLDKDIAAATKLLNTLTAKWGKDKVNGKEKQ